MLRISAVLTRVMVVLSLVAPWARGQVPGNAIRWGDCGECAVADTGSSFIKIEADDARVVGLRIDGSISTLVGSCSNGLCDIPQPNQGYIDVDPATYHVVALRADSTFVGWGSNYYGALSIPDPDMKFLDISTSYFWTIGVLADSTLVVWGNCGDCQIPAAGNEGFVAVVAKGTLPRAMVRRADGSIGTMEIRSTGVGSPDFSGTPSPNAGFIDMDRSTSHYIATREDGSLEIWGACVDNLCEVPEPNSGFITAAAGDQFSLGLKTDGSIVAWSVRSAAGRGIEDIPEPNEAYIDVAAGSYGMYYANAISSAVLDCPVEISVTGVPYQSVFNSGSDTVIEMRNDYMPQALNIAVAADPSCSCSNPGFMTARLVPRSGTGRVFESGGVYATGVFSFYFLIDELTSAGYYDLVLTCADGSVESPATNLRFDGYQGYSPNGVIRNSITDNTIRGASVSLWRYNGVGFELYAGQEAVDGTFSFGNLPSGTYNVLVQYDLAGEQWRGPYIIEEGGKSALPYIDVAMTPIVNDTAPPSLTYSRNEDGSLDAFAFDSDTGVAAVDVLPGESIGTLVFVEPFAAGVDSASMRVELEEGVTTGTVALKITDMLGNFRDVQVTVGGLSQVPDRSDGILPSPAWFVGVSPNPFNPTTDIRIEVGASGRISLRVYDVAGRLIKTLVDERRNAGSHLVSWPGDDDQGRPLPSGVYQLLLVAGVHTERTKVTLLK